ncbi:hypothetical protein [Bacteroides coprosuis]|uniref:hypothetical protein n=1 Tax=Bacteroides coprosuis TaxID=151276 RepID=UPI001D636514|nr:hypothetical protein [Bacteroides coprosuis]HJD92144.1 hypothetical protein [Bacteroides coprosuis]
MKVTKEDEDLFGKRVIRIFKELNNASLSELRIISNACNMLIGRREEEKEIRDKIQDVQNGMGCMYPEINLEEWDYESMDEFLKKEDKRLL